MGPSIASRDSQITATSQSRIVSYFESLGRDLRFTFRSLRRKPGFTMIVVLSLALGIGANTAIFSVVDATLLRPLPVPNPDNFIVIDVAASRLTQFGGSSYLDLQDFRSRSRAFESLAITQNISAGMSTGAGEPQVVYGSLVSGNFFSTVQIHPALGREFRPEEDEAPGKSPVVILSNALWGRAFANDPNIIGKQIKLNSKSFTIIGVTPKAFTGSNLYYRPDIYVPVMMAQGLTTDGNEIFTHRGWREFDMLGRLKPGVTAAQAQAEMDGIMRNLEKAYPDTNKDTAAFVRKEMDRRMSQGILLPAVIMTLVMLVLLIACANVASLLMARATARMKEISTQFAVGATRGTLVRQLLTESAVLATMGGMCGILLGLVSVRGFQAMLPYSATPSNPVFHLDLRVMTFAMAVSLLSVFLCGLAPAFSTAREAMVKVSSNVRAGNSQGRAFGSLARRILIAGQIALSTMLLIGGGLFLKAFMRAEKVDLGFNPGHVLLVALDPSQRGYSVEKAQQFQKQLVEQVSTLPGMKSASVASSVPFLSGNSWDISVDGYTAPGGEKFMDTNTNQVSPGYFSTMQIPLLWGREFTDHDNNTAPLVAIVNETLARRFIVKDGDLDKAIGHKISLRDHDGIVVVGVVKDSNPGFIGVPTPPTFYMSYAQMGRPSAVLHVRTDGDPSAMTTQIRAQLSSLDPEVAPISVMTFNQLVSSQGLFQQRVSAILGGAFGVVALLLAVVGLYGVVSFLVARRTQEIGLRIALGAQRGKILRMVLRNGISLAFVGLVIGGGAAFLLTPQMGGLLLDVNPRDPQVFVGIAAALIVATLGASWIPALRATRVDPMEALRYE
ncbi:MAG TPA: ABC transporter permease [Terriglobales bacterium]